MQVVRTVVWVVLVVALLLFSLNNWNPVDIKYLGRADPRNQAAGAGPGRLPARAGADVAAVEGGQVAAQPADQCPGEFGARHRDIAGRAATAARRHDDATRRSETGKPSRLMSSPIYIALDLPRLDSAIALARKLKDHIGGIKLGLEFFCAHGHHGVHEIAHIGLPIFLDLKLHDIPNTVAAAMQAVHVLEPAIVTVHAAGGRAMMEDAKAAAGEHCRVVGVTVLTSLDASDLERTGVTCSPHDQALRLAELAHAAGLDGIVCSGHEVAAVHHQWKDGFFVVPGLRPSNSKLADQKRTVTPREARDAGASVLVIGRPISRAEDPVAAARAIEATL